MKKRKVIVLALFAITTIAGLYGLNEYSRGHVATSGIIPADKKTATALAAIFEANETKADALYNDKVLLVNGKVQKLSVENNTVSVALCGNSPMSGVMCQFEKSEEGKLQDIKPGDMVTIKGICTGYLMDVILVRCVLIN